MVVGYRDFFIETTIRPKSDQFPYLESEDFQLDPPMYVSSTPPVVLGAGYNFYFTRVPETEADRFVTNCSRLGIRVVGESWHEVWRTYEKRDLVFRIDQGIARPPGVFAGDEVPEFDPNERPPSQSDVNKAISLLKVAVTSDNALSDADKSKINGYLSAIEAIAGQHQPDVDLALDIAGRVRQYAAQIAVRVGQRVAVDQVIDFLNTLKDLF